LRTFYHSFRVVKSTATSLSAPRSSPELDYPFHDKTIHVISCGRICLERKKVNLSTVCAGQAVGIKEVEEGIWRVSLMNCDLGYVDLEEKTLKSLENPFGPKCYL
jgi:hypothetical protein